MDIVDSQIHMGPGGIERILGGMDAVGIKAALIDEAWVGMGQMPYYEVSVGSDTFSRLSTPTAELAALTHPDRFSYLLRVDDRDPELRALIRLMRDTTHCRALRTTIGLSTRTMTALAAGGFDPMFKEAADCGLPVFIAIPGNVPALRAAVKKYPSLTFVIDHCGMPFPEFLLGGIRRTYPRDEVPSMGGGGNEAEFEKVLSIADLPNVALKWAHAQCVFGITGYPPLGLRPFLKKAIGAFGSERIMWASDVSVNVTGDTWASLVYEMIDNNELPVADRENILGGTARRILNWPAPTTTGQPKSW